MASGTTVAKKRNRRKYTAEFQVKAVKLATQPRASVAEVARDLGVHETNLYEWVERGNEQESGGLSFEEREELIRSSSDRSASPHVWLFAERYRRLEILAEQPRHTVARNRLWMTSWIALAVAVLVSSVAGLLFLFG